MGQHPTSLLAPTGPQPAPASGLTAPPGPEAFLLDPFTQDSYSFPIISGPQDPSPSSSLSRGKAGAQRGEGTCPESQSMTESGPSKNPGGDSNGWGLVRVTMGQACHRHFFSLQTYPVGEETEAHRGEENRPRSRAEKGCVWVGTPSLSALRSGLPLLGLPQALCLPAFLPPSLWVKGCLPGLLLGLFSAPVKWGKVWGMMG